MQTRTPFLKQGSEDRQPSSLPPPNWLWGKMSESSPPPTAGQLSSFLAISGRGDG